MAISGMGKNLLEGKPLGAAASLPPHPPYSRFRVLVEKPLRAGQERGPGARAKSPGQEEAQSSSSCPAKVSSLLIPEQSSGVGRYRRASATVSVLVCGNTLCSYSAR